MNYKAKGRAAKVLKSTFGWQENDGTNEAGLNVFPSGYRFMSGNFMNAGKIARFWSSSQSNAVQAYSWQLEEGMRSFIEVDDCKSNEMPLRCVEND